MMFFNRLYQGCVLAQKSLSLSLRNPQLILYSLTFIVVHWAIPLLIYWIHTQQLHQPFVMPPVEILDLSTAVSLLVHPDSNFTYYSLGFALHFVASFIRLYALFCLIYHAAAKINGTPSSMWHSIKYTASRIITVICMVFVYSAGSYCIDLATPYIPAHVTSSITATICTKSIQLLWYLMTVFMVPLLVLSRTRIMSTFIKSIAVVYRQLPEFVGGNVVILLTSLITISLSMLLPVILISISPDFYLGLVLMILSPFTAFFLTATEVLLVYVYEGYKESR